MYMSSIEITMNLNEEHKCKHISHRSRKKLRHGTEINLFALTPGCTVINLSSKLLF